MNSTKRHICFLLIAVLLVSANRVVAEVHRPCSAAIAPIILEMTGPLTDPQAEVSGMTWQGDTLVVLPENPTLPAGADQLGFFLIDRAQILAAIDGVTNAPITPRRVLCVTSDMSRVVPGFDGLEAVGVMGNRCFMTLEARDDTAMTSYLVCGDYDRGRGAIIMDLAGIVPIPLGPNIPNLTTETLVIADDRIIALAEANGHNVNPRPVARVYNAGLEYLGEMPLPNIEYRVTDATGVDRQNRFWVINYFYPPDAAKLRPPTVPTGCVERLLELQITRDSVGHERIVRTESPPVVLIPLPDGECRNWEAVARLAGRGFLLMTDKYPGTLLAFVPYDREP